MPPVPRGGGGRFFFLCTAVKFVDCFGAVRHALSAEDGHAFRGLPLRWPAVVVVCA